MLRTSLLLQTLGREITLQLLVIELRFLHSVFLTFNLVPFYSFRDMLRTSILLQKIKKGSNYVKTGDMVMVFAFCTSPHSPLSLNQVSFIYLQHF